MRHYQSNYQALQEANDRILKYHSDIYDSEWLGADKLYLSQNNYDLNIDSALLDSLYVVNRVNDVNYQGYIQCGMFSASGQPRLMLVNRRANYVKPGFAPRYANNGSLDNCFEAASPQDARFVPNALAHATYGTYVGLYDSYDEVVWTKNQQNIDVTIGPGDGKLLQMCASLPDSVAYNADLKGIAYLSGPITINNGAVVTVNESTITTILPHSTILVKGGSILNLAGIVTIADNVSIIVEQGSSINFNGAICTWGYASGITIDDSEMTATSSTLKSVSESQRWQGILASNESTISLDDTEINGAVSNTIYNSNVYLSDCSFNVPANSTGLIIVNDSTGHDVRISASVDGKGFFGKGMPSYGLAYGNQGNSTAIWNICFKDLSFGLANLYNTTIRDSIISCAFADNEQGIYIMGNHFSPYIYDCNFFDNGIGIDLDGGASPEIKNNVFDNCMIGIKADMSSGSTGGIYDCVFRKGPSDSNIGIVSRGSNLRVADNKFYTNYGILNHSGSILNMGSTAKNLFNARIANLKFQDTASYNAYVQLYLGHNDFYHETPGPLNQTYDFHFDSNWYVCNAISADYNWFEDSIVEISCPGTPSDYVRYRALDPAPNVFLEIIERMALALVSENEGDYLAANNTYRAILDEDLDAESMIMRDALDAYYRTSPLVGDTASDTQAYLVAKTSQYADDDPMLTKYIEDYMVKSYLNIQDYQAAIDMIQVRLGNHESEIDSLLAVMDLEVVLQLAAMDASKRPITTKYAQYAYPDRKIYSVRHAENWDKLNQLFKAEEDLIPIPNSSVISSNYPNPFNPSTTIAFSIPEDSRVLLTIFNIKGQKVKDLVSENMMRGHHKFVWDGRDDGNRKVSSGIYFVKLNAAGNSYT
ncbi:MAG: FlgD immunoglobulin-like domain containing protein, partial [Candidatus Cloacimonetes bacterium]|nr:FlgD immunoglobulin-like domain containing protein [Candidatus Cloacimonadota bacterium]